MRRRSCVEGWGGGGCWTSERCGNALLLTPGDSEKAPCWPCFRPHGCIVLSPHWEQVSSGAISLETTGAWVKGSSGPNQPPHLPTPDALFAKKSLNCHKLYHPQGSQGDFSCYWVNFLFFYQFLSLLTQNPTISSWKLWNVQNSFPVESDSESSASVSPSPFSFSSTVWGFK